MLPRPVGRRRFRICKLRSLLCSQARAHKRELIQFIVGDDGALALGLNFAFTLRDLGYDHWFAFGGEDDTTCRKFMQAIPDGGGAHILWSRVWRLGSCVLHAHLAYPTLLHVRYEVSAYISAFIAYMSHLFQASAIHITPEAS